MSILPLLFYIALSFLSPADVAPAFAQAHGVPVLAAIAIFASLMGAATKPPVFVPQLVAIPLFLGIVLISRPLNGWVGGASLTSTFLLEVIPLIFCTYLAATSIRSIRVIALLVAAAAVYITFQCLYALGHAGETGPYVLFELTGDSVVKRIRGVGFLADPNDLAQFLIVASALLGVVWKPKSMVRNILFVVLPASWFLYCVYLTRSRGALLGVFIVVLMGFRYRSRKFGLFAAVAVVAGFLALGVNGGRSASLSSGTAAERVEVWSECLQTIKHHPIVGVGFQNFYNFSSSGLTAHNSFLLCMAELGIVGYFLWVALLVMTSQSLNAVIRCAEAAPYHPSAKVILASFYAFLGPACFLSRTYAPPLYLLIGLAMAIYAQAVRHTQKPIPAAHWLKPTLLLMFVPIIFAYMLARLHWR